MRSWALVEALLVLLVGLVGGSLQAGDERISLKEESQSGDTSSLVALDDDTLTSVDDSTDKRAHVFRYGKRAPSVFRYGKRAPSVFRYGKRIFNDDDDASLLFPKRIFRYGKRHADQSPTRWELMGVVPRDEGRGGDTGEEEEAVLIKNNDDIDAIKEITVDKKPIFRYG